MKRRGFLGLVAGAVAWPYVTRAQQGCCMRRLGVLAGYDKNDSLAQTLVATLVEGLAASGWRDGHNLQIDWRWAGGDAKLHESCAAELLALRPDVLVAQSSPSVLCRRENQCAHRLGTGRASDAHRERGGHAGKRRGH